MQWGARGGGGEVVWGADTIKAVKDSVLAFQQQIVGLGSKQLHKMGEIQVDFFYFVCFLLCEMRELDKGPFQLYSGGTNTVQAEEILRISK